ncbi:MAG: hypothetical protein ACRD6X_22305, partial [Pyrinomonadaceae bacterium]
AAMGAEHFTVIRNWNVSTSSFTFNWAPQEFQRRRINSSESKILLKSVTAAADNIDLCRKYIKDLIETAASLANLGKDSIISTNVETLYNKVLNSRGGTDLAYGGIFLEPGVPVHGKTNGWMWVGAPGFGEISMRYGSGPGTIESRLANKGAGISTIHELLHVAIRSINVENSEDLAYASAAAALAGDVFTPSGDQLPGYQASQYWGERLNQACGFASPITNKMTNHKLYK